MKYGQINAQACYLQKKDCDIFIILKNYRTQPVPQDSQISVSSTGVDPVALNASSGEVIIENTPQALPQITTVTWPEVYFNGNASMTFTMRLNDATNGLVSFPIVLTGTFNGSLYEYYRSQFASGFVAAGNGINGYSWEVIGGNVIRITGPAGLPFTASRAGFMAVTFTLIQESTQP